MIEKRYVENCSRRQDKITGLDPQWRTRAIAPAVICMMTPTTHPSMIAMVQKMCGSARNTITPTETKAANAARKVPTALRNSAAVDLAARRRIVREMKRLRRRIDP